MDRQNGAEQTSCGTHTHTYIHTCTKRNTIAVWQERTVKLTPSGFHSMQRYVNLAVTQQTPPLTATPPTNLQFATKGREGKSSSSARWFCWYHKLFEQLKKYNSLLSASHCRHCIPTVYLHANKYTYIYSPASLCICVCVISFFDIDLIIWRVFDFSHLPARCGGRFCDFSENIT